jgi:hypothetical protein
MTKWIFGILTGALALVICVFIMSLLVKDSNTSWVYFINAAISYYAGSSVYKYFKKKETVDNSQKS